MSGSNATAAGLVTVIVGAVGVVGWSVAHRDQGASVAWREAWAVAAPQNPTPETLRSVRLPARLSTLTADGTALVWRARDGRAFLIGQTQVGYKGNWRGVVYGPAPLARGELGDDGYGRQGIVFDGPHDQLVATVARARGGGLYEVFFDLN